MISIHHFITTTITAHYYTSSSFHSPLGDAGWGSVVPQSFDNIFTAMGALYEISTTEGWVDVMIAAVDQRYFIESVSSTR